MADEWVPPGKAWPATSRQAVGRCGHGPGTTWQAVLIRPSADMAGKDLCQDFGTFPLSSGCCAVEDDFVIRMKPMFFSYVCPPVLTTFCFGWRPTVAAQSNENLDPLVCVCSVSAADSSWFSAYRRHSSVSRHSSPWPWSSPWRRHVHDRTRYSYSHIMFRCSQTDLQRTSLAIARCFSGTDQGIGGY